MEKLVKLLNEYSPDYCKDYPDDIIMDEIVISKRFGFIKWLVDNDKIDRDKCGLTNEGFLNWYDKGIAFVKNYDNDTYKVTEFYLPYFQLLMILSIQNEPLTFLISILK